MFFRLHNISVQERLAVLLTLAMFVLLPGWLLWYERMTFLHFKEAQVKIFTITGLGSQGRWTLEKVSGYNYWWRTFSAAEIELTEMDSVILRLQSADVTHIFYAPTLGVGPIVIEPGLVKMVAFKVKSPGIHYYYCQSICGECHYFMRGRIVVGEVKLRDSLDLTLQDCAVNLDEPVSTELYNRGKYLFAKMGCIACHGPAGEGGVVNPNYIKRTVPALNRLAQTMSIYDEEEAARLSYLIEFGKKLEQIESLELDIANAEVVMEKYKIVRDVIRKGRAAARADTTSFSPPLFMPSWEHKLTEQDIDAILTYLLKVQVWEEEE